MTRATVGPLSVKVRKGNYERLFDAAHVKVRAWKEANIK